MKRCWGLRHIRYYWYAYRLARWVGDWSPYGYSHASPADVASLDAIWEGKA